LNHNTAVNNKLSHEIQTSEDIIDVDKLEESDTNDTTCTVIVSASKRRKQGLKVVGMSSLGLSSNINNNAVAPVSKSTNNNNESNQVRSTCVSKSKRPVQMHDIIEFFDSRSSSSESSCGASALQIMHALLTQSYPIRLDKEEDDQESAPSSHVAIDVTPESLNDVLDELQEQGIIYMSNNVYRML
jgi:hypothetical protein